MRGLQGRTAAVIGASSGIGYAVAERLLQEGAQCLLIASPADAGDLEQAVDDLRAVHNNVAGLAADISLPETPAAVADSMINTFGNFDILINNAGIAYFEDVLTTPLDHLTSTLAVNVRGCFAMSQAAAQLMIKRQVRGCIVNTISTAAFAGEEYQVTYNASKGALASMTRSFAIDLAPYGIRVNGVAPGWVRTRATHELLEDGPRWAKHRSRIALDRAAEPEEIAAVHAFLASDDASYVTGAVFLCDGGLTAGYRYSGWAAAEEDTPATATSSES